MGRLPSPSGICSRSSPCHRDRSCQDQDQKTILSFLHDSCRRSALAHRGLGTWNLEIRTAMEQTCLVWRREPFRFFHPIFPVQSKVAACPLYSHVGLAACLIQNMVASCQIGQGSGSYSLDSGFPWARVKAKAAQPDLPKAQIIYQTSLIEKDL